MAYALHIYTSTTAGQTDFQFTFPYIKAEHVKLYVNYTEIAYAVATRGAGVAGFQIYTAGGNTYARLNDTNGLGTANTRVEVRRISSLASVLVDYADGSTLTAADLDTSNLQHLYVSQEVDDALKQGISISATTGQPTLNNQRLTNVLDPTAAQDAATKNYVDTNYQPLDAELTELATMASNTAAALADLTQAEVQAIDGLTATTTELNLLDGVTATTAELNYVDGVTSNVQTQLNAKQPLDAELTELATMSSDTAAALADLTQAEVQLVDGATLTTTELNYVDGVTSAIQTQIDGKQPLDADLTSLASCQSGSAVNLALLTSGEVAVLDGATLSTNELNVLDGITSTTAELNKLDGVTSTAANLNVVSGMTKATSLTSNSDTELPTSKAVADHVTSVVNALGGFVAVNGPTNFPATQPAQGVVVSIKDVGSGFTTSSNEITITNGAGTNKNVRITGFPSEYAAATLVDDTGLQVTSDITNSTSGTPAVHRYVYHKQLAKESDVKALSDDINDFNARYRVLDNVPTSNNDEGDLVYVKSTDKMMVYDATTSAYKEVQSIGSFDFNTLTSYNGTGGNSAVFNGAAYRFVLSNPPSFAQQLICSVNGVVQKPNAGTSQPSEGFAIDGSSIIFSAAPASNAPFFIITLGSAVNIGTPSNGTVTTAKVADGAITEAKLDIHAAPSGTDKFLKYTSNGMEWVVPSYTTNTNTNVLAGGTITGDVVFDNATNAGKDLTWDMSDNALEFTDDTKAVFGTGDDLTIYHDGNHSHIVNTTGDLRIDSDRLELRGNGGENYLTATENGATELYYDHTLEFATKSGGVKLNGHSECAVNALGNVNSNPTFDFTVANYITLTLTGNVTVQNPTTESIGQSGSIIITQDGTGSRTCAWSNQFKWTGGTAPTLSTAANAVDRIDYLVVAADTIHCVASLAVS